LLREDPKSPSAEEFRTILAQLQQEERQHAQLKFDQVQKNTYSIDIPTGTSPEVVNRMAQIAAQNLETKEQIDEAEKEPEPVCTDCGLIVPRDASSGRESAPGDSGGTIIHARVDEVSVLFAATDRGKSVTDLASSDIQVRDNSQPPKAILHFRNETQLPLRLGLVIDTSNSVTDRFKFEQAAAIKFLQKVVTGPDDQVFVVGVNNTVLLAEDFTADQKAIAHAIEELAPTGGTALWDAVEFGADKLANRPETQPVARVMVVISDGEDNSSSVTLKEVIAGVLRREVAVYSVSTRDDFNENEAAILGGRALQTISQLTGGAAYRPGSVAKMNGSLAELQEVIRSRYLISYKPASFQRDGHYRPIEIKAAKSGHKLRVYARRGYYASAAPPPSSGVNP
jgi:Ca-activated chloride channel family protein